MAQAKEWLHYSPKIRQLAFDPDGPQGWFSAQRRRPLILHSPWRLKLASLEVFDQGMTEDEAPPVQGRQLPRAAAYGNEEGAHALERFAISGDPQTAGGACYTKPHKGRLMGNAVYRHADDDQHP